MNADLRHIEQARGFSLIELIFVVAIVGTITAIAMPRFGAAQARYQVDITARRVAADLELARSTAERMAMPRVIAFHASEDTYTLPSISSLNDPNNPTYKVSLDVPPFRTDLVSAWFDGDALLTFDGFGIPDSTGIVVLRSGNESRAVTLDQEGKCSFRILTPAEAVLLSISPPPDPLVVGVLYK